MNPIPGLDSSSKRSASTVLYQMSRRTFLAAARYRLHHDLIYDLARPVPHWRKHLRRVKDLKEALFYIQVWNNYWSDDWELGEISTGFEVEISLSWWAVDDSESGVVIRVVKDPSCPGSQNHASWMQQGPVSRRDHRDTSQRGMGQNSLHNWLNLLQKRHASQYPPD